MSETANVQLIRQLYDAMSNGDLDAALAMMTAFVVPGPPEIGAAGTWRGHRRARLLRPPPRGAGKPEH